MQAIIDIKGDSFLDDVIYSRNRNFRLFLSSKFQSPRVLKLSVRNHYCKSSNRDILYHSFVTVPVVKIVKNLGYQILYAVGSTSKKRGTATIVIISRKYLFSYVNFWISIVPRDMWRIYPKYMNLTYVFVPMINFALILIVVITAITFIF